MTSDRMCPHCGREIPEGATVCLFCMEPLREKTEIKKETPRRRVVVIAASGIAAAAVILFAFLIISGKVFTPKSGIGTFPSVVSAEATGVLRAGDDETTGDKSDGETPRPAAAGKKSDAESGAADRSEDGSSDPADEDPPSQDGDRIPDAAVTQDGGGSFLYDDPSDTGASPADPAPGSSSDSSGSGGTRSSGSGGAPSGSKGTSSSGSKGTSSSGSKGTSSSGSSGAASEKNGESTGGGHTHTPECYEWVVDVPYRAAVYKDVKVIDVPYSAAVYGDVPVEYTDYTYKVYFYPGNYDTLYFSSTEEFENWFRESGAKMSYSIYSGELYIDGSRVFYEMSHTSSYKAVRYEYGLISPEQPEVSHTERKLVSAEQEEQGHFELICGY